MGGLLSSEDESPRLKTLRSFVAQRPQDPFPRYALGMELKGCGDLQAARDVFAGVMAEFPDYIACYAPAGEVLVALDRRDDARSVYAKGIEVCARKGDGHTRGNLEDALAALD